MASSKLTTAKDKWLLTKSNTADKERALRKNLQEKFLMGRDNEPHADAGSARLYRGRFLTLMGCAEFCHLLRS